MSISKILSWTVVIFWMILIFNLSSQVAQQSNQLSTEITEIIVKTVERIVPQADLDIYKLNNLVRKSTHFFVSDRGGEVKDIIIDSAGATVGVGVYFLTSSVGKLRRIVGNDKLKCTQGGK